MFACWLKRRLAGVSATRPRPSSQARARTAATMASLRCRWRAARSGSPSACLEVGRFPQGERELERDRHRAAVRVLRGHAGLERVAPVHEVPPRQPAEESVRAQPVREPVQHRPRSGELAADEGGVVPPGPVVVDHAHPEERERGDELLRRARVAAEGDSLGAPRALEGLDRLSREPVVAGHGVGDERLDARVAHVLQLLVVGAVDVRLVRAGASRAPADLPQAPERRVAGVEAPALFEWVAGEVHGQAVEGEGLSCRFDLDPHVAPRAPPERVEDAPRAAVGDDLVLVADEALALELVAVALPPGLRGLEQRLLVADADPRPASAGEDELGVRGHERLPVDEERGLRVRRHAGRALLGEALDDRALGLHDRPRADRAVLHRRQLVGDEQPAVGRQLVAGAHGDRAGRRGSRDDGRLPAAGGRARGGRGHPAPVVLRRVEPLARAHDEVLGLLLAERLQALGPGLVARLRRALPGGVGGRGPLRIAVALARRSRSGR